MDEFELIRTYFSGLAGAAPDVVLGVGDDAALLAVPAAQEFAVTTDTLVAGRHFSFDCAADEVGWKSLAVNLSDLAAMGAQPRWFTLALTLEKADPHWLAGFARGLAQLARQHDVALVGGDTTRGPLSITITAMGLVPRGQALRRDGARVGDAICVTGTLGDAALALREAAPAPALAERLHRPTPRVGAGLALRGFAHAAIDLSDGLAGDLSHVLHASGVGARIDVDALPMSQAFAAAAPRERAWLQTQGGDDYELCVCLSPDRVDAARALLDVPLTRIGEVRARPGLHFVDGSGATMAIPPHGYRHFS